VARLVSALRSPRLALGVLAFAAVYAAAGAWLAWAIPADRPPPAWAAATGLDHPFSAWPFLACVALLFASTLACTWGRRARVLATLRGELPPSAFALPPGPSGARAFLEARGFRGEGELLRRHAFALWGGWVLHVGLLAVIAGAAVQQALHDGGAFDVVEGAAVRLREPGITFAREHGPLAAAEPPDLEVALESFDPFLHQRGYAPDRRSRLAVVPAGGAPSSVTLDRSAGVRVAGVELFQAIPTGLALLLDVAGAGVRSVRLDTGPARVGAASLLDPAGRPARLVATAERDLDDPLGTGRLDLALEQDGRRVAIAPGQPFDFGGRPARVVGVRWWARFTWAVSPGMPAVLAGFAIVLLGCALLAFPAGVARLAPPGSGPAARVFLPRGRDVLLGEWRAHGGPP
jgi:hypothetical protein